MIIYKQRRILYFTKKKSNSPKFSINSFSLLMPPSTLFIVPHFITHIYKKRAFSVCVLKSLFDILFDIDSVNGAKALISF